MFNFYKSYSKACISFSSQHLALALFFYFPLSLSAMAPVHQLQPYCAELLRSSPLTQGLQFQYLKPEQAHMAHRLLERSLNQFERIQDLAKGSPYNLTQAHARQYHWPTKALKELQGLLGWIHPFGVFFDPDKKKTRFVALGDPSLVQEVELQLFASHTDPEPIKTLRLKHQSHFNDGLAWLGELDGPWEGAWYQYVYRAQPEALSDFGEAIPEEYPVLDPFALLSVGDRARIYFPPKLRKENSEQPEQEVLSPRGPQVTLELSLRDLTPKDIPQRAQGGAQALLISPFLKHLTKPFSALEMLPVRSYESLETFASQQQGEPDTLYFHYWGYMPTGLGVAADVGGPDSIALLLHHLKERGQRLIKDEVIQHTANKMPGSQASLNLFHFAMHGAYRQDGCDRTGCGNTTNLDWGNSFTKIMLQMVIHDLLVMGWGGHRYDLMGAIPRDTAQQLTDLAQRHCRLITGEPYACPYHHSFWNTEYEPLRGASLWDHRYRQEMRRAILEQSHFWELVKWLGGGSYHTWVEQASDRTAILETHDGETLTHLFQGDLDKVVYATALQLFSQGDVTLSLSQVLGIAHSHLDNTPLDLRELTDRQLQHMQKVLHFVKLRHWLNDFFAYPYLDPSDPRDYVEISEQGHNSGYIYLKKPASQTKTGASLEQEPGLTHNQQVLLVVNNSDNSTLLGHDKYKTIHLPPGDWLVAGDSRHMGSPQHPKTVSKKVKLEPFTVLWLVRQRAPSDQRNFIDKVSW